MDIRRRHPASLPDASDRLKVHFCESWSVLIVNCVPSRYSWRGRTIHTMAGHSRFVGSYTRSALLSGRDQYPIGFIILSGYSCHNTHPTWRSQGSVSSVIRPSAYSNAKTGAEINFYRRLFIASSLFWFGSIFNGSYFRNLSLSGNSIFRKFGTKRLKTLQKQKNDISSVKLCRALSPLIPSVVCDAVSERLGRVPLFK